jgi:hypothetical protein
MTDPKFAPKFAPDVVAGWFGLASEADLEASHERYAAGKTRETAIEDELDAQFEQEAGS